MLQGDASEGLVGGIGGGLAPPEASLWCWGWVLAAGRLSGSSSRTGSPRSGFHVLSAAAFRF